MTVTEEMHSYMAGKHEYTPMYISINILLYRIHVKIEIRSRLKILFITGKKRGGNLYLTDNSENLGRMYNRFFHVFGIQCRNRIFLAGSE